MRTSTFLLVALASTSLLAATGCKRAGESAAEAAIAAATGGKAVVNQEDGTTTIQSKDGKQTMTISTGGDAALPAGFPKDVFLPTDYKVESALDAPGAIIVHVLATGNVATLTTQSQQAMQAQGWKSSMTLMQSAQGNVTMWEKGDRHATLTIAGDDSQGGVQVGYQLPTDKQ